MPDSFSSHAATLRPATLQDAARLWAMARDSESLEQNSAYAYCLFCSHFARTTRVAEIAGTIVGFVAAYRPPEAHEVLFVWQVGTDRAARGRGIASSLLHDLLEDGREERVRYLEATVTPSNEASKALFRGIARSYGVACTETVAFRADQFPDSDHEDEVLFRIGPLPGPPVERTGSSLRRPHR